MKQYYKEPNFYYILIPAVITIWAIILSMVSIKTADSKLARQKKQYTESQDYLRQIIELDPERLDYKNSKDGGSKFDYASVIEEFASKLNINSANYSLQASKEVKRGGKRTQSASITIKPIDVQTCASFISELLLRWPDLECDSLTLTNLPDGPDLWNVSLKMTYNF